jgi:GxxExxY protein
MTPKFTSLPILLYKEEVYQIVGAAMEVYNQLGPGFLEAIYQEAMEIELRERGIPFRPQVELPVIYKGKQLKKFYITDFLIFDQLLVEIKATSRLAEADTMQILNQLKATNKELGLLINFGHSGGLEWERKVNTKRFNANVR